MNSYCLPVIGTGLLLTAIGCGWQNRPMDSESRANSGGGNIVPAGTEIKVRTARLISSRAVSPGERLEAVLAEPLVVEGKTNLPAGATVILSVVDSKPGITLGPPALVLLKVTQLRRSLTDHLDVNTAGLHHEGPEIAAGSVLTFRLETPALIETQLRK